MNKKINIPVYIWVAVAFVGLLNYIPIFFVPEFLNELYYPYKQIIIVTCFIILLVITLIATKKKIGIITLSVYLLIITFSGFIRQLDNKILIWYNAGVLEAEGLRTPILGYKKIMPRTTDNRHDVPFDAMFKFNNGFGMYEALVFDPRHGLTINSFDGDYSLHKVYNENWWWYIKSD